MAAPTLTTMVAIRRNSLNTVSPDPWVEPRKNAQLSLPCLGTVQRISNYKPGGGLNEPWSLPFETTTWRDFLCFALFHDLPKNKHGLTVIFFNEGRLINLLLYLHWPLHCQRIWYNKRFAQHMHSFHVLHEVLPKKRRIQSKSRQQYDKKNGEEMKHTLNLQETLWPTFFRSKDDLFFPPDSHLLWVTCFFLGFSSRNWILLGFPNALAQLGLLLFDGFQFTGQMISSGLGWREPGLDRLVEKRWIIGINHERY